jgi:hypothetical protein
MKEKNEKRFEFVLGNFYPGLMSSGLFFLWFRIKDIGYKYGFFSICEKIMTFIFLAAVFLLLFANIVIQKKQIDRLKTMVEDIQESVKDSESLIRS